MNEEATLQCEICKIVLPVFAQDGKHNFCPHMAPNGEVIQLCMDCKIKEIAKKQVRK